MRRREFITLLGGAAAAWPLVARGQDAKQVARIGLLSPFSPDAAARWYDAFRKGLRDLGWIEGQNISIVYRYSAGKADLLPELAADLVRLNVDIIVVSVSDDALAAHRSTKTIPIVMASVGDPVASGLVASLARPGGNITGLSQEAPELAGKRLATLKELVPALARAAVLWNPQNPSSSSTLTWMDMQVPARQLQIQLLSFEARSPSDFEKAFEGAIGAHADALVITPDPLFADNLQRLADLATRSHLPTIFHLREFVRYGGLVSYGIDRSDQFRRAATYVDKILKGAKPADLPVQQPIKFDLAVNLKTAKSLNLTVPQSLLLSADEVIE
jgi:putative tryptophan/tyrosine transport system substrate-binding protein